MKQKIRNESMQFNKKTKRIFHVIYNNGSIVKILETF